uniref:SET domain-containing protein n=1 Tax=Caenorhabditis tropicalis TaxID=1561998 RepID=A0A1I7UF39_9PELO
MFPWLISIVTAIGSVFKRNEEPTSVPSKRRIEEEGSQSYENGNIGGGEETNESGSKRIRRKNSYAGNYSDFAGKRQVARVPRRNRDLEAVEEYRRACGNFVLDLNAVPHCQDPVEMIRNIKEAIELVDRNDFQSFIEAEKEIRRRFQSDPVLMTIQRQMISGNPNENIKKAKCTHIFFDSKRARLAPKEFENAAQSLRSDGKRFRIRSNTTDNVMEMIPAYCHISRDPLNIDVPVSLTCKNTERNIPSRHLKDLDKECENFLKTFGPIFLKEAHFFNNVGFACSEICACKGCCTNNVTWMVDMKLNKLELVREHSMAGFKVRTLNQIPAGTPFMEFTGKIMENDSLLDRDYAFQISEKKEVVKFGKMMGAKRGSDLQRLFTEAYTQNVWMIDPKKIGNVARMFNHSCQANVEFVRVFQKSFSPSNMRLLVVPNEDVFPGEELTLNYGDPYLRDHIGFCVCGTDACLYNRNVKKRTMSQLEEDFVKSHQEKYAAFKEHVLDKIEG